MIGPTEPLILRMDDGQVIGPITMPEMAGEDVDIELVQEIGPRSFDRCPICGDPATEDEHVPPQSIGGEVMTRTCGPCNHRFGSYVEPDLLDWLDGVMLSTRLRSDQVGHRPGSSRRIGLRRTPQGFVLMLGDGRDLQEVLMRAETWICDGAQSIFGGAGWHCSSRRTWPSACGTGSLMTLVLMRSAPS